VPLLADRGTGQPAWPGRHDPGRARYEPPRRPGHRDHRNAPTRALAAARLLRTPRSQSSTRNA